MLSFEFEMYRDSRGAPLVPDQNKMLDLAEKNNLADYMRYVQQYPWLIGCRPGGRWCAAMYFTSHNNICAIKALAEHDEEGFKKAWLEPVKMREAAIGLLNKPPRDNDARDVAARKQARQILSMYDETIYDVAHLPHVKKETLLAVFGPPRKIASDDDDYQGLVTSLLLCSLVPPLSAATGNSKCRKS